MKSFLSRNSERLARRSRLLEKAIRQRLGNVAQQPRDKLTLFVTGLPRSGTNMLMEALERSLETDVFHEFDPRAFDDYHMRDRTVIHELVDKSPARVVVVKALLEGHATRELLDEFAPAKAVWMFRHFDDAINSNMVNWPGGRNQIEDIIVDRDSADWRGRGMTDETHALVKSRYVPGMNDASALALFFYYRHQLFYDQGFDTDPRVYLMDYDELVATPRQQMDEIAHFADLSPSPRLSSHIHAKSVRRKRSPDIVPQIRELADGMYERLKATRAAKHVRRQAA